MLRLLRFSAARRRALRRLRIDRQRQEPEPVKVRSRHPSYNVQRELVRIAGN